MRCTKEAVIARYRALPVDLRRAKNRQDWERRRDDPVKQAKQAARQKRWAAAHREELRVKHRVWSNAYKKRDPERRRMQNQIQNNRARAKKMALPNTFQYSDWLAVLELFEHRCAFCGADSALLDLEHLVAMTQGGPNTPGNVVPACRPCNANKWRKTLEQFCLERGLDAGQILIKAMTLAPTSDTM